MSMPRLFLEMAAVGEASPDVARRIEADPHLRALRDRLIEETKDFLEAYPASEAVPAIRERLLRTPVEASGRPAARVSGPPRRARSPRALAGLGSLAAAALVLVAVGLFQWGAGPADDIRTKGLEPQVNVYRQAQGETEGVERVEAGASVEHYTALQISYIAAGRPYGTIFSVDGRGIVTLHHPEHYDAVPRLQPFGEVHLPYGYQLDDAPDFERFYFVTSPDAFDVRQLLAYVESELRSREWLRTGTLTVPAPFSIADIGLIKAGADR